jgi:hypothetical protein
VRKRFRKLLCKLGFHDWQYGIDKIVTKDGVLITMMRYCPRCCKLEEVPADKRGDFS